MADERTAEHIGGRMTIKTAVEELMLTIEDQEGVTLTPEAVERLKGKVLAIQEKILKEFDQIASDLREHEYSMDEKKERIVASLMRAKPLIQKLSELQLKLDPEANMGAPLYQIYREDIVEPMAPLEEQAKSEQEESEN